MREPRLKEFTAAQQCLRELPLAHVAYKWQQQYFRDSFSFMSKIFCSKRSAKSKIPEVSHSVLPPGRELCARIILMHLKLPKVIIGVWVWQDHHHRPSRNDQSWSFCLTVSINEAASNSDLWNINFW